MRRRRIPGPDPVWETAAASAASRFRHLDTSSTARLLDHARELDRTRGWEGLGGLVLTSEMRAEIAVGAALLTVGIGLGALRDVTSILVGPSSTIRRTRHLVGGTLVTESDACVLGEALLHGPLRLAWDRVVADAVPGLTASPAAPMRKPSSTGSPSCSARPWRPSQQALRRPSPSSIGRGSRRRSPPTTPADPSPSPPTMVRHLQPFGTAGTRRP